MSSSQALIRTQGTSLIGAQWLNTDHSLFAPQAPALSQGFIRENLAFTSRGGSDFVPGGSPRFEIQRDIDFITVANLRWENGPITVASWNGGATFARYIDMIGIYAWNKIVVKSGTQTLQTIYPDEIFIAIQKLFDNDKRRNIMAMVGAGTPVQRSAICLANQEITCPLLTCLGLGLHGDMSQGLYVRGLNDFLTFEVSFNTADMLIETDGTQPTAPAAGIFQNGRLSVEGYHVDKKERREVASIYKQARLAITFDDCQYSTFFDIPAATSTTALVSFQLQNISQPVTFLCFIFRWVNDLARRAGGANGTRGYNPTNIAGWYNPGATASSILSTLNIKSGNNDVLRTIPFERLVGYQHDRDFKGDSGIALPAVSFAHDASMKNAVTGFLSFDQIERPTAYIQLQTPTRGTAHATVGAAATADIGASSDLRVQVVAFTKMDIDIMNFLLSRPFN